ncbi:MAG: hypothetical protein Q8R28_20160 [Dehalococcoidia bacterium]|nr:hypothetical protein [Dehalococcoidia bacterium]
MPDVSSFLTFFYWFQLHPGPPSVLYWVLAGLYTVGLGGSAAYFVKVRQRSGDNAFRMNIARRVVLTAGLLCVFGLIFVGLRFWEIPVLSLRFWELIIAVGAIGLGAFLGYYFARTYPVSLAAFEAAQLRQRYLPKPRPKSGAGTRRRKRG